MQAIYSPRNMWQLHTTFLQNMLQPWHGENTTVVNTLMKRTEWTTIIKWTHNERRCNNIMTMTLLMLHWYYLRYNDTVLETNMPGNGTLHKKHKVFYCGSSWNAPSTMTNYSSLHQHSPASALTTATFLRGSVFLTAICLSVSWQLKKPSVDFHETWEIWGK